MNIITDNNFNIIIQDESFDDEHVFVYIIQLNKSNGKVSQTYLRDKESQEIKFTLNDDGYYTICKAVIPKDYKKPYYYLDGKFYKGIEEVSLEELIYTNPKTSEIVISYYYYFQVNKLRRCFVNAAQKIIDERTSIKCDNVGVNNQDIYKRDLIWTSLNVIKYLVDLDQYEEAERLLERITGCNGLCDTQDISNNYSCGCGN